MGKQMVKRNDRAVCQILVKRKSADDSEAIW